MYLYNYINNITIRCTHYIIIVYTLGSTPDLGTVRRSSATGNTLPEQRTVSLASENVTVECKSDSGSGGWLSVTISRDNECMVKADSIRVVNGEFTHTHRNRRFVLTQKRISNSINSLCELIYIYIHRVIIYMLYYIV